MSKWHRLEYKDIQYQLADGLTRTTIAQRYGCSKDTVNRCIRLSKGNDMKQERHKVDVEKARKMLASGMTQEDVAHYFDCSVRTVARRVNGEKRRSERAKPREKKEETPMIHMIAGWPV